MTDTRILLSLFAGIIAIYYYFFKNLNFFKKHGIIHIPAWPVLGNMVPVFLRQLTLPELIQKVYNLNQDAKYVGYFDGTNPIVMIRDPELIKAIGIKYFDVFPDHSGFINASNEPMLGKNLFALCGEKWRNTRTLLSPAFTSSKMKIMFKLMNECAINFTDFLSKLPVDENVIEMKEVFNRYTTDVIATCAFGISVDSMRNPKNEFYFYGKQAVDMNLLRGLKFFLVRKFPVITRILGITFYSKQLSEFFKNLIRNTIQTRDTENIVRPDMLQLMMESRGKMESGKELTIEDMTAQAFGFFIGGFDSVSTVMCFAAHEIAVNPNVQTKLRNEIDEVIKTTNGELTYDILSRMEYLDAVVNETLRLWPPFAILERTCMKNFELPPALPGNKVFFLKKGMSVWFPVHGLNRDSKYFEKPDEFYPERFLNGNKKNINAAPYIPFGIGPRMCLGNRFALLETKVMLFHLLARCELKMCAKTTYPLRLDTSKFSLQLAGGFWLKIQARDNTSLSSNLYCK